MLELFLHYIVFNDIESKQNGKVAVQPVHKSNSDMLVLMALCFCIFGTDGDVECIPRFLRYSRKLMQSSVGFPDQAFRTTSGATCSF